MNLEEQQAAAREMVKAVYEDGTAEINGRHYVFGKVHHQQRLAVFSYFTSIKHKVTVGDFSFMTTKEYNKALEVIQKNVTFEDSALNRQEGHWDKYPEDYINFVITAFGVFSYPFMPASAMG